MPTNPWHLINKKSLDVSEMWFYKRILNISWTAKISKLNVFNELEIQTQPITTLERDSHYFCVTLCEERKWNVSAAGKIYWNRDRGSQWENFLTAFWYCMDRYQHTNRHMLFAGCGEEWSHFFQQCTWW